LIIDDSEVQLYIAQFLITKHAISKTTATFVSARSALEYLTSIKNNSEDLPDLILLDISMPDMDGFQFLEAYMTIHDSPGKRCPIAMLTSSTNASDIERARTYPSVKGYLIKPIDADTTVEQLINLHSTIYYS
jgi:CheY-like chemotaxis protein